MTYPDGKTREAETRDSVTMLGYLIVLGTACLVGLFVLALAAAADGESRIILADVILQQIERQEFRKVLNAGTIGGIAGMVAEEGATEVLTLQDILEKARAAGIEFQDSDNPSAYADVCMTAEYAENRPPVFTYHDNEGCPEAIRMLARGCDLAELVRLTRLLVDNTQFQPWIRVIEKGEHAYLIQEFELNVDEVIDLQRERKTVVSTLQRVLKQCEKGER